MIETAMLSDSSCAGSRLRRDDMSLAGAVLIVAI